VVNVVSQTLHRAANKAKHKPFRGFCVVRRYDEATAGSLESRE